jgi:hypothetical protein
MSEHLVQFYESTAALAESAARFLAAGLAAGDGVVVIATPAHREELDRRLFSDGLTARSDRYVALDAARTLSQFMVGDTPDATRFVEVIEDTIRRARRGDGGRVRAFGEMVALLALDGCWPAALHLEELWSALVAEHALSLLCAYPTAMFRSGDTRGPFETICAQHTAIVHGDGCPSGHVSPGAASLSSFVSLVERAIAVVRPLIEERRQVLSVTWPEQDVHVEGDRIRLVRVFASLLANAVKYTPACGRIRVSAAHEDHYAVLRLRDSGAGLLPGVLSDAFDPSSAVSDVRSVVEMYGGVVEVRSSGLRQGVEFVVRLPVAGTPAEGHSD